MFRHDAVAFSTTCTDSMRLSESLPTSDQCPQVSELSVAEPPYAFNARNKQPSPSSSLYSSTRPCHFTWSSYPSASVGRNTSTKDCTSEADDSLEILERDFEDPFSNGTSFTLARYTERYIQQMYHGQHPARQNSAPEVPLSFSQTTGIERHESSTWPPIFTPARYYPSVHAPGPLPYPLVANASYAPQSYAPTGSESSAGRVFASLDSNKVHQAASTLLSESSLSPSSYVPSPSSSRGPTQPKSNGHKIPEFRKWHVSLQAAYERLRELGSQRAPCPIDDCKNRGPYTLEQFKSHVDVVHCPAGSRLHACPLQGRRKLECQSEYNQRSLLRHIAACHFTDIKIYCNYDGCHKDFTRLDSAQRHFQNMHVGEDGNPKTKSVARRGKITKAATQSRKARAAAQSQYTDTKATRGTLPRRPSKTHGIH
jgi:hypothetical protein